MKSFCAKQVNLHYGTEFHNAKYYRFTICSDLLFIISHLSKIKKPANRNLRSKLLIFSREISNLSDVSQRNNIPRLPQSKALR